MQDDLEAFLSVTAPEHTPIQAEMAAHAAEEEFPIIGPHAGGVLRLLARLTDAEDVFEFGSGFGYSASWFIRGGADHVILTEVDEDELELGEELLSRADMADHATFLHGNALEFVDDYEGPFDVVLIDVSKGDYADAFEKAREKIRPGGVVVADNVTHTESTHELEKLADHFESGASLDDADETTRGIGAYLGAVRDDPDFETSILPVGKGLALSVRV